MWVAHSVGVHKRVKIVLAVVAVALIGVIVWAVASGEREPVYHGKRLSEWLQRVYPPPGGRASTQQEADHREMAYAVRQIGTNAIPMLLRMLRAKDSGLKVGVMGLLAKLHIVSAGWTRAYQLNGMAAFAFEALGDQARCAVPDVIQIGNERISPASKSCAADVLRGIGPGANGEAIPALLQWATNDAEPDVRAEALMALRYIHSEPDRVVPVLIRALDDPSLLVKVEAIVGLGAFGKDAQLAIPSLVKALNDPSIITRRRVAKALYLIDPEAAARAGITNSP